jgi:hypothetical protein
VAIAAELVESRTMKVAKVVRAKADAVGIGLSALCMVHCLAFPVIIAFAPAALRALPGDDATHRTLAVGIGLAGSLAFRSGYKVHRKGWILALFLLGLALVSAAAMIGEPSLPALGEAAITTCGSVLLVTAHWCNRSLCHSCIVSGCHHGPPSAPYQNTGDATSVPRCSQYAILLRMSSRLYHKASAFLKPVID